jgi:hypothetical protein
MALIVVMLPRADMLDAVTDRMNLALVVLVWTACGAYLGGVAGLLGLLGAFLTLYGHIGLRLGHRYPEIDNEHQVDAFIGVPWARVERDRRFASRHLDRFLRY